MGKPKEEVMYHENFNLEDIVTPVNADVLRSLLTESGYDDKKTQMLYEGFKNGFSIHYCGNFDKGQKVCS